MSNNKTIILIISVGIILIMSGMLIYPFPYFNELKNNWINSNQNNVGQKVDEVTPALNEKTKTVRSKFRLPNNLLHRQEILDSIMTKFQSQQGMDVVSLVGIVGIGGSGKTTIARMVGQEWRKHYPNTHIYEINAENPTTIATSYMDFAINLAQTSELREELNYIKQMQDYDKKIYQLCNFVRHVLKDSKDWLLIFDNVESKKEIEPFLPYNKNKWGDGNILITTRNKNIADFKYFNTDNIIHLDQLSITEAIKLFAITYSHSKKIFSSEEILQIKQFLKEIPPFPHDINIAAKYIRNNNITLENYLEMMRSQFNKLDKLQQKFFKNLSDYKKSRYQIISLPFEQILRKDPQYKELLFLISMLDSQDIPRRLLEFYSDKSTVQNLLYELNNYSLITCGKKYHISTLSFHRSTLNILQHYLAQDPKINDYNFKKYCYYKLCNFIKEFIVQEDFSLMKIFVNHLQVLLKQDFITNKKRGELYIILGKCIYPHGDISFVKSYIEKGLRYLKNEKSIIKADGFKYLADCYRRMGDMQQAKEQIAKSLALYKDLNYNYGYAQALCFASSVYSMLEELQTAKELLKQSITLSNSEPNAILNKACAQVFLASIYKNLGNYLKAEAYVRDSINLLQIDNLSKLRLYWAQNHLGSIYKEMGLYPEAREINEKSIKIYQKNKWFESVTLEWVYPDLATIYRNCGDYVLAKKAAKTSLNFSKRFADNGFILNLGRSFVHLGKVYHVLGQYEKAHALFLKGKESQRKVFGENSLKMAWVNGEIAKLYNDLGKYDEAEQLVQQNIEIHKIKLPLNHIRTIKQQVILGRIYYLQQRYNEAESILNEVLTKYQNHFGKDHLRTAEIRRYLGDLYLAQGKIELAEESFKHALLILEENNNHPDRFLVYESLAALEQKRALEFEPDKALKQAQEYLILSLKIATQSFPADSAHLTRIRKHLSNLKQNKLGNHNSYGFKQNYRIVR